MPSVDNNSSITTAEILLPADNLQDNIDFFIDQLGFRMDSIAPADNPRMAQLSGHGLHLRLDSTYQGTPACLRLNTNQSRPPMTAPNDTRIVFSPVQQPLIMPEFKPSLSIERLQNNDQAWVSGRAGMQYRDLIPDRAGGAVIASHIRIPEGGPVPDNVHYHNIHFQMIYCYRGWVKLVYEDQGEPFVMQAGDCVLQPPMIRHRVLESSDGLEVIEIGCPAEHMTYLDHDMDLPTGQHQPNRDFGGQHYTFHQISKASWHNTENGFAARDLGISTATHGIADAKVYRTIDNYPSPSDISSHKHELAFWFVLQGQMVLQTEQRALEELSSGAAVVIPKDVPYAFKHCSDDLELLNVCLLA